MSFTPKADIVGTFSSPATVRLAITMLLSDHLRNMVTVVCQRKSLCFIAIWFEPLCPKGSLSLKNTRRESNHHAEQTLYRFDLIPPDVDNSLSQLHAAFSRYRPRWDWCRQCFTVDDEARTRSAGDPQRATLESFGQIYFEHPNCSGGREHSCTGCRVGWN